MTAGGHLPSLVDHYRLMARYNAWMNERLYGVCANVPDAERRADHGAFFASIHGTLNHLLYGDLAWMGRFVGPPCPHRIGEQIHADFDDLRARRESEDARIIEWTGTLDPGWLATDFTFTSNTDGVTRTRPAWTLVSHLFNHQTHHRGQLTTLLVQLGHDTGVTDLPWLPALAGAD